MCTLDEAIGDEAFRKDIHAGIAASKLAALLKDDLHIDVDVIALRNFVRYRWRMVAACGHAIHEGDYAPVAKAELEDIGDKVRDEIKRKLATGDVA